MLAIGKFRTIPERPGQSSPVRAVPVRAVQYNFQDIFEHKLHMVERSPALVQYLNVRSSGVEVKVLEIGNNDVKYKYLWIVPR